MFKKLALIILVAYLCSACMSDVAPESSVDNGNGTSDDMANHATCQNASCQKWETCLVADDGVRCAKDADGDGIADEVDPCPYTPHQTGKQCNYVIDGIYHIYDAENLAILANMETGQMKSIHTIYFENDINLAALGKTEVHEEQCFVEKWDDVHIQLSNVDVDGRNHKITSVSPESKQRCSLTHALFDAMDQVKLTDLQLDYDVKDREGVRGQARALLANQVKDSQLIGVTYGGTLVSRQVLDHLSSNDDLELGVGGLVATCIDSNLTNCVADHISVIADNVVSVGGLCAMALGTHISFKNEQAHACENRYFVIDEIRGGWSVGGLLGVSMNTNIAIDNTDYERCQMYLNVVFDNIQGTGVGGLVGMVGDTKKDGEDESSKNVNFEHIAVLGSRITRYAPFLDEVVKKCSVPSSSNDPDCVSMAFGISLFGGAGGLIGSSNTENGVFVHDVAMQVSEIQTRVSDTNHVGSLDFSYLGGFVGMVNGEFQCDSVVSKVDDIHGKTSVATAGFIGSIMNMNKTKITLDKITNVVGFLSGFDKMGIYLDEDKTVDELDIFVSGFMNIMADVPVKLNHVFHSAHTYAFAPGDYGGLFLFDRLSNNVNSQYMNANIQLDSVVSVTNRYYNNSIVYKHAVTQELPEDMTCYYDPNGYTDSGDGSDTHTVDHSTCFNRVYYFPNNADDLSFESDASDFTINKVLLGKQQDTIHALEDALLNENSCLEQCTNWHWDAVDFRDDVTMNPLSMPYLYQPALENALVKLKNKHCDAFAANTFCEQTTDVTSN